MTKTPRWNPGDTAYFGQDTVLYAIWETRKLPPTGDAGHPALWLALVLIGLAGLTMTWFLRPDAKRKKIRNHDGK